MDNAPSANSTLIKILVVDDDPALRRLLADYLNRNGYDTLLAADARDLEARIQRYLPQMVILDRMLPDGDGMEACRRLRQAGENIPIILLSARDEPNDKIAGLQAGADDYMGKPFSPHELLARMEAILRRQKHAVRLRQWAVKFGPLHFDFRSRQLWRSGQPIKLTTVETNLLEALISSPGQPLTRDHLLALLRDNRERTTRAVDIAILRLRRVIEDDPKQPRWIQTVWGVGYCFSPGPHLEEVHAV